MNFSRLIKAMAVVGLVGFGSYALGSMPGTDNFEGYDEDVLFREQDPAPAGWTINEADESMIVSSLVTALGELPQCAVDAYGEDTSTQLLELNTEGNDLTYAAVSEFRATVLVNTLLKVVGSDTAPTIDDDEVQTAVYLSTAEDENKLYAWSSLYDAVEEEYTNGWTQLSTTVTNGQWICLKIEIDYSSGFSGSEPRGRVYVDGQNALSGDGYFVLANKTESYTKRSIESVSFRGTGMVDNFSVTQTSSALEFAWVITEAVNMEGTVFKSDPAPGSDILIGTGTIIQNMELYAAGFPQYELVDIELLDGTKTVVLQTPTGPSVNIPVTAPTFTNNGTYYLQGKYAIITNEVEVNYLGTGAPDDPANGLVAYNQAFDLVLDDTVVLDGTLDIYVHEWDTHFNVGELSGRTLELPNVVSDLTIDITANYAGAAPAVITDNDTLAFDEIVLGGDPITVDFTGEGTVGTPGTMFLIVTEDLVAGPDFTIEVGVTATAGTPPAISGTVSIDAEDLADYDTLFIKGLATDAMVLP